MECAQSRRTFRDFFFFCLLPEDDMSCVSSIRLLEGKMEARLFYYALPGEAFFLLAM